MPEFTQALANKLAAVPWSIKVMAGPRASAEELCYFFKYLFDDAENLCCFIITDTVDVWAEVLDSKYTSHRARHSHSAHGSTKPKRGFALPYHDADEEAEWRRAVVNVLGEVHASATDGIVEVDIRESEVSDLSVYVWDTIRDFHWRWDVISVRQMAASILSKQLFMPLVTLATVTSSLGQSIDDASEATLRTVAERKASTAKAMPTHHLRGFFSKPSIRTVLSCIAQVDGAPKATDFSLSNAKQSSVMSVDMADATANHGSSDRRRGLPPLTRTPSDGLGRSEVAGATRKGKGRDSSTDDEDEGTARKIPRGDTPRRSDARFDGGMTTTPFSKSGAPRVYPSSTSAEADPGRDLNRSALDTSYSRTIDEDDISPPLSQVTNPHLTSPKPTRPSPRTAEKPKSARTPLPPPRNTYDDFGDTQTQTQASSDDSDREAELERRVRAAGAIGSAAVRTPAGGGLGSRMIRKKF